MAHNARNKLLTTSDLRDMLLAWEPKDLAIYQRAFVHSSYCRQNHQQPQRVKAQVPSSCVPLQEQSNLGLAWLGDSVLQLIVTEALMEHHPTSTHTHNLGQKSALRSAVTNNRFLGALAQQLGFGAFLLIDLNLESNPDGGRSNLQVLADCFEAFVAALYQDLGHQACKEWVKVLLGNRLGPHPQPSPDDPQVAALTFNAVQNKFSDGASLSWKISQSPTAFSPWTHAYLDARIVMPAGVRVLILPLAPGNTPRLHLPDGILTVKLLMHEVSKYYQEHPAAEHNLRSRAIDNYDFQTCRELGIINLCFQSLQPSSGHPSDVANLVTACPPDDELLC